ncbi:aspartate/glutamate racemase family protein [Uliginosibacterium sp. sgz301328]|uniref:aspartate/glutamate racemase family protein n=1 Tax=Uliginosibacterium sp. sgz301328 TaxID=3243764 RepID=UPI00359EB236
MSTGRVLVINPNTTATVTDLLARHARAALPNADIDTITAPFGAQYISSEVAYTVAGHAVLDAWAVAAPAHVVLIGCFGDPGLHALREVCPAHVVGLASASMSEAAARGRFAIITGGQRWQAMLERLAVVEGFAGALAGIEILPQSGLDLQAGGEAAIALLGEACLRARERWQADGLILGGAALAGWGDVLANRLGLPVIDSVSAGMRAASGLLGTPAPQPAGTDGVAYSGISAALAHRLAQ